MSNRRCCGDADDDEEENERRYFAPVLEAYHEQLDDPHQTIEEWIALEGSLLFDNSEIYKPVSVAVALCGSEYNAFHVDTAQPDWHAKLETAVRTALERGHDVPLASAKDKVSLETIRGESIAGATRKTLEQHGVLYATVNGRRTVDMTPSKQAGLGAAVRTPVTHSPEKQVMLADYTKDLFDRAGELIIGELINCNDSIALEEKVASEDEDGIKMKVANLIESSAGLLGRELPSFEAVVRAYGEPLALQALARNDMKLRNIAEQMAGRMVNEVATQMQSQHEEIDAFYRAQQLLQAQKRVGGSVANRSRTIFAPDSAMAKTANSIDSILSVYPTHKSLQRAIVINAFGQNKGLIRSVVAALKNAIPPKQRQRIASRYAAIGWNHDGGSSAHTAGGHRVASSKPPTRGDWSNTSRQHHDHRGTPSWSNYARTNHRRVHAAIGNEMHEKDDDDEETQARVRMYVASGLVPPQFRPYETTATAATPTDVAQLQSRIAQEPPSIEPYVKVASAAAAASVISEPPSLEVMRASAPVSASIAEPPSLEPLQSSVEEPPSLEVIAAPARIAAHPDYQAPVHVRRRRGEGGLPRGMSDDEEQERREEIRRLPRHPHDRPGDHERRQAGLGAPVPAAAKTKTPPPAFELRTPAPAGLQFVEQRKQPVSLPTDDIDHEEESLPSLDGLARLARAASAIKTK